MVRSNHIYVSQEHNMADALWTPEQVADYLAVPLKTLYAWRHRGDGPPAIRVGRHLRYKPADLEAWLAGQADTPQPAR
jgi:excisionase family DNA binding protein